ncbi:MAG: hypothetical protein V4654_12235 [Bdellovibrionota bacterium]
MFKFISIIILFMSNFAIADDVAVDLSRYKNIPGASDAIGEVERGPLRQQDSEYQPSRNIDAKPQTYCLDKNTMLDKVGCLQANGKIAKHCSIKLISPGETKFDPCDEGSKNIYICREYAICLKDESGDPKPTMKNSEKSEGVR